MKFTKLWDFDKVSSREFALYFLVYLFSCFDHFIGVFDYSVGRFIYYGVHGQREELFLTQNCVVFPFINKPWNSALSRCSRTMRAKKSRKKRDAVQSCSFATIFLLLFFFLRKIPNWKKQRTRSDVEFTLKFKAIIFQPQTQLDFETKRTVHDGRIRLNIKSIMWLCNKLYLAIFRFNK